MVAAYDHSRLEAVKRLGWMKFPMHLHLLEAKHEREKAAKENAKR